jgi:hypothetical protein
MDFEDYLQDATDLVDAWEISDEDFPQAVNDQARLMAGMDLEPNADSLAVSPYLPLRF